MMGAGMSNSETRHVLSLNEESKFSSPKGNQRDGEGSNKGNFTQSNKSALTFEESN